jgi:hypothetical protein
LRAKNVLLVEYASVEGYAYRWGHLIEVRLGRFVLWRVVPVALWERLSDVRAGSPLLIEELLTRSRASLPYWSRIFPPVSSLTTLRLTDIPAAINDYEIQPYHKDGLAREQRFASRVSFLGSF